MLFRSCVRSAMLHAIETWALTKVSESRLLRNDRTMIRWICNTKPEDQTSTEQLLSKLKIPALNDLMRASRLRWYGHVVRSDSWMNKCQYIKIVSNKGPGRPKKTWEETIRHDRKEWNLTDVDPQDRTICRAKLQAASNRPTPRAETET